MEDRPAIRSMSALVGALLILAGVVGSAVSYLLAGPGESYVVLTGLVAVGLFLLVRAVVRGLWGRATDASWTEGKPTGRPGPPKYRCRECGEPLANEKAGMYHAETEHGAMTYPEMKRTWERA